MSSYIVGAVTGVIAGVILAIAVHAYEQAHR